MENFDVLIIGAGACGLMCGLKLAEAGKKIMVIEARNRLGGRIHTIYDGRFSGYVEAGAEFIHGDAPVTMKLLKESGIEFIETSGRFYRVQQGSWQTAHPFEKQWDSLLEQLKHLKQDISIGRFLNIHFPGETYTAFRESVIKMVEGYDAADSNYASALALSDEWNENDKKQYRIKGGYGQLINYLSAEIKTAKGIILSPAPVKQIKWKLGSVEAITATQQLRGRKAVITIPLSLLKEADSEKSSIEFSPRLPHLTNAVQQLGMGAVIKIIMQWKDAFWERKSDITGQTHDHPGFLFSDECIPTWWTQLPDHRAILTGWLAGPKAEHLKNADDAFILKKAMDSLASIFKIPTTILKKNLEACKIINWPVDPFAKGGYAYSTVNSKAIKKIINTPVENTLFFGGEALYEGSQMGTVEAAFANGEKLARAVLLAF